MISLPVFICFLLVFWGLEVFFAISESAFIAVNKPRLFRKATENHGNAVIATDLLKSPEILFSTTVLGTNFAIVFQSTWVTFFIHQKMGSDYEWVGFIFLTPFVLLLGEFVPKMFARDRADAVVLMLAPYLKVCTVVLYPVTQLFVFLSHSLERLLSKNPQKNIFINREELKAGLAASKGSDVTHAERELIEKILNLNRKTVKDLVRPLIEVVTIEEDETIERALDLLTQTRHSKLPVYQKRVDQMTGTLIGIHCLLEKDRQKKVKELMLPPFFVPESKPLDELLLELKSKPMAIVVNEFGGAEGIVTSEDVIEEIVGEIEDEYDEPPKLYYRVSDNTYLVSARMELEDLQTLLKVQFPQDEDFQTLGGFLLKHMQRIPKKWDTFHYQNIEFIIQSATERSIEEVYVTIRSKLPIKI